MRRINKLLMVVLVVGMMIGGSVPCLASESAAAPAVPKDAVTVTICSPLPDFLLSEVHQQNYLRYLVKEFDPSSLSKWETAFTARKAANKQLQDRISVSFNSVASSDVPGIITVTLPDKKSFSCTSSQTAGVASAVDSSANQVFVTATDVCKTQGSSEAAAPDPLYSDFEKAVELGDASAIKAVLPKILDKYAQVTEDMVKDFSIEAEKK